MRLKNFFLILLIGVAVFFFRAWHNPSYWIHLWLKKPQKVAAEDMIIFFNNNVLKENSLKNSFYKDIPEDKKIKLSPSSREITFITYLKKTNGKVLFLINFRGYWWLDEKSALHCEASLLDFKNSLAYIDWKFLDLWQNANERKHHPRIKITLSQTKDKSIDAYSVFITTGNIQKDLPPLQQIIFAGDPLLDEAVTSNPSHKYPVIPDCSSCVLFPSEKELILKRYQNSELILNENLLKKFDKTKPVYVTIQLP